MQHEYLLEMKRLISHIGVGSTIEHAAHTYLGKEMDGKPIAILAYVMHAAVTDKLGVKDNNEGDINHNVLLGF